LRLYLNKKVKKSNAQVEKYGSDSSEKHRKMLGTLKQEPSEGSDDWIFSIPPGTARNLAKPAVGYGHPIPASKFLSFFRRVPTGNSLFSAGSSQERRRADKAIFSPPIKSRFFYCNQVRYRS